MLRVLCSILVGIALVGCSSVPQSVAVPKRSLLLSFEAAKNLKTATLQQARWGGRIAKITNLVDKTLLEVVYFELGHDAYPDTQSDQSAGRFKAYVPAFLDSEIYQPGRLVTLLGYVGLPETGKIGDYHYRFPVLKDAKVHLWSEDKRASEPVFTPFILHTPIYYRF